jgi:hypothetical protein
MKTFIGIDPGATGGISIIQTDIYGAPDEYICYSMKEYNDWRKLLTLAFILTDVPSNYRTIIGIEKQQFRMGQRGVFTTLVEYGKILGMIPFIFENGYELLEIDSKTWTSKLKLQKTLTDKKPSMTWLRLYNTHAFKEIEETSGGKSLKSYDGVADAFCIAIYLKDYLNE